ncbi:MAG: hypothetical protein LIO67_09030 [Lachnospiraceae bacterium]|nr:hypothetical protein [Lachnospiraceae bacterium]
MKTLKKTISLLLALCLVLGGCGSTGSSAEETNDSEVSASDDNSDSAAAQEDLESSGSVTLTDMKGREITLKEPAERIVALTASDCEILYAIGAGDTLVGRGEYCDYPEEVLERNPDFIVTITMYYGEGPTPEEEIISRDGWDVVTAVQNGAILNLQNNELSRPAPRLADGAQMLFDFVYGDTAE